MSRRQPQLYLIHGNNESEVNEARYELVGKLLSREERETGLAELRTSGGQPLTLARSYNEIVEELGTASFIPGAKRLVVVYDLRDFLAADRAKADPKKKGKAKPAEDRMAAFAAWCDQFLHTVENIAIFVVNEDDEKFKFINRDSPLYRYIQKNGVVIEKREKAMNFDLEDQLLAGNTIGAVGVLREWLRRATSESRGRILSTVGNLVELVLQARCAALAKEQGIPESQVLPQGGNPSLSRVPDFKVRKIHQCAARHSMESLRRLVGRLNKLQAVMYPSGEEPYILDWEDLLELVVVEFCAGEATVR